VNYDTLPVNNAMPCPHLTIVTAMRFDGNYGSQPNYEPNSFGGPKENADYKERPRPVDGPSPSQPPCG